MFVAAMAASAPSAISTNPNPRLRPVSRSVTTDALVTVPCSANNSRRSSEVVPKARFPTYNFLLTAITLLRPRIGRAKEPPSGEGRRGQTCELSGGTRPFGWRPHRSDGQGRWLERKGSELRHRDGSDGESRTGSAARVGQQGRPTVDYTRPVRRKRGQSGRLSGFTRFDQPDERH